MSFQRKIRRAREKKVLKKRINELLEILELSKSGWKRINLTVVGKGLNVEVAPKYFTVKDKIRWGRHRVGHKPSLKSQYSILWDLWEERLKNKKFLDELKEQLEEQKEKGEQDDI